MRAGAALGALLLAAVPLSGQAPPAPPPPRCPIDYLDVPALESLLRAQEVNALEAAYRSVLVPDSVTRLIYASRMATVAPGKRADLLMIEAMPRTRLEFDLLSSLADPDLGIHARVANIAAGNWLDQALAAVVRQEKGAREFLMLSYLAADRPDIGELLPALFQSLRRLKPTLFQKARQSLPPKVGGLVDGAVEGRGDSGHRPNNNIYIVNDPGVNFADAASRNLGSDSPTVPCAPQKAARTVREALGPEARIIRIHSYDARHWKDFRAVKDYVDRVLDAPPEGGALFPGVYWAEGVRAEIIGSAEFSGGERRPIELAKGYAYLQSRPGCPWWGRYLGGDRGRWVVRP